MKAGRPPMRRFPPRISRWPIARAMSTSPISDRTPSAKSLPMGLFPPWRASVVPATATLVALNNPNGLWVREDGQFYILDHENGLIRKVDTNGIMTALVDNLGP